MKVSREQIIEHYNLITPYIFDAQGDYKNRWTSPYSRDFDWAFVFSPIEEITWQVIRSFGKVPMYPQYPVGKYFVDFGNPVIKVAIECDGKEWHTDKEKDDKRDLELLKLGWTVYRISGAHCFKSPDERIYDSEFQYLDDGEKYLIVQDFYETTIEGLICAIGIFYFDLQPIGRHEKEIDFAYECLCERLSLYDIQVAAFDEMCGKRFDKEYLDPNCF